MEEIGWESSEGTSECDALETDLSLDLVSFDPIVADCTTKRGPVELFSSQDLRTHAQFVHKERTHCACSNEKRARASAEKDAESSDSGDFYASLTLDTDAEVFLKNDCVGTEGSRVSSLTEAPKTSTKRRVHRAEKESTVCESSVSTAKKLEESSSLELEPLGSDLLSAFFSEDEADLKRSCASASQKIDGLEICMPELFVPVLFVANSYVCRNRAYREYRVSGEDSVPQLVGTLLHEIVQERIRSRETNLEEYLERLDRRYALRLFSVGRNEVLERVRAEMSRVVLVDKYDLRMVGCEQEFRSHGLCGRIDVVLEGNVPLEIKTGVENLVSHDVQLLLYATVLGSTHGFLYYLKTNTLKRVERRFADVEQLFMRRNELVLGLRSWSAYTERCCSLCTVPVLTDFVDGAAYLDAINAEERQTKDASSSFFFKQMRGNLFLQIRNAKRESERGDPCTKRAKERRECEDQPLKDRNDGSGDTYSEDDYSEVFRNLATGDKELVESRCAALAGPARSCVLNESQKRIVDEILCSKSHVSVKGLPGTGKSTVIAYILDNVAERVLVTSTTNAAVDNILERISRKSYKFGTELLFPLEDAEVLASTVCSLKNYDFRVPLAIVDECTQVSVPYLLRVFRLAKKVVLFGDDRQLGSISAGKHRVLEENELFQRYFAGLVLNVQYRMCSEIMDFANEVVYDNELVSGTGRRNGTVRLVACTSFEERVPRETKNCAGTTAVLCYFRSLVTALSAIVEESVVVETIDKIQGREFDSTIVCVSPGYTQNMAEIVRCRKRLAVAITRAKSTLVVLGSREDMRKLFKREPTE